MTNYSRDELEPGDRALIERIDAEFRPSPVHASAAARFSRGLERRIEQRRRLRRIALPVAALAGSAALALLWLARPSTPEHSASGGTLLHAFADPHLAELDWDEHGAYLPDDYRALASLIQADEDTR